MADPIKKLGLSCPKGGEVYICQDAKVRFLGCCAKDPCADGSGVCKQDDLRYTSFDKAHYSEIPAQSCSSPTASSTWWTCSAASPPFMGCCSANPCDSAGCPKDKLLPARLADSSSAASVFVTPASTTKTTKQTTTTTTAKTGTGTVATGTTTTGTGTTTTGTGTGTTTGTGTSTGAAAAGPTSAPTKVPGEGGGTGSAGLSPGATAGIAVGVVLALAIIAFLAYWCGWRRRGKGVVPQEDERQAMNLSQVQTTDRWSPYQDSFSSSPHPSPAYPAAYSPDPSHREFLAPDSRRVSGVPSTLTSSWLSPDPRHLSHHTSRESQQWGAVDHPPMGTHLPPVAELGNTSIGPAAPVELPGAEAARYGAGGKAFSYRPLGRSAAHEFGGHPERI